MNSCVRPGRASLARRLYGIHQMTNRVSQTSRIHARVHSTTSRSRSHTVLARKTMASIRLSRIHCKPSLHWFCIAGIDRKTNLRLILDHIDIVIPKGISYFNRYHIRDCSGKKSEVNGGFF